MRGYLGPTLTLFTSLGTLICCALPALFVALGAGAALAGLVSSVPQLIWFSEHKGAVFIVAGVLILCSGFMRWKNRNAPCPVDPDVAAACMRLRRFGAVMFWASVVVYLTGLFFAYVAVLFV